MAKKLAWIKCKQWSRAYWPILVRDALAPVAAPSARIAALILFITLFFVLPPQGYPVWRDKVMHTVNAATLFVAAYVVYVLFAAITAIFKTNKQMRNQGSWFGSRFVYHSPQRVCTVLISPGDNDRVHVFHVGDTEAHAYVELKIEIDSPTNRVKARIGPAEGSRPFLPWEMGGAVERMQVRLPDSRKLGLHTRALPETVPIAVRVFVVSWEIQSA